MDSKIRNIEHAAGETKPTGQFNYTFEVMGDLKIVPQTYSQFMVYLDARRRAKLVNAAQEMEGSSSEAKKESVMG